MISRSFGLNIGATIGFALYLSQAISVAFYVIAFTEAFSPLFEWVKTAYALDLPRQVISVPSMLLLSILIIKKGASIRVVTLYVVVTILFASIIAFFLGSPTSSELGNIAAMPTPFAIHNSDQLFVVFAIIFPAFTGMDAGVGLSGDLKNPQKSIPFGTISATVVGMIIYFFIAWKLSISATPEQLVSDQLIMSKIAIYGWIIIPVGLAAATISSAIGSILVAPRTLQAIAADESFPLKSINRFISKGNGELNEPKNATIITSALALMFVILGNVDAVAKIISMFFMVTYGAMGLISILHHFGASPSYRPSFKSKWYFSLLGFVLSFWLMFQMNPLYAFVSIVFMVIMYLGINSYHHERKGLSSIFQGTIFQLSRKLQVYNQKTKKLGETWRPAAICISENSFESNKTFELLSWIAHKHGFGTYIHLIKGYFSKETNKQSGVILEKLIKELHQIGGNMIVDTIISPSYTTAVAQTLQLPSSAGMSNNMIIFDYNKDKMDELDNIIENLSLAEASNFDICIFGYSPRNINYSNGIHVWIRDFDRENANLMILLSYIILGHPSWKKGQIKIFNLCEVGKLEETNKKVHEFVLLGRLPITGKNITIIEKDPEILFPSYVIKHSNDAALTLIGSNIDLIKHEGVKYFEPFNEIGDVLFVCANGIKEIS